MTTVSEAGENAVPDNEELAIIAVRARAVRSMIAAHFTSELERRATT